MEKDIYWKRFFSDNERYADIINGIGCNGKQIVHKEDLNDMDTQTGYQKSARKSSPNKAIKNRDCIRKVAFGTHFVIIGIDSQEELDYSLPVRIMSYDIGAYEEQLSSKRKEVRNNPKGLNAGEYLYGFRKEDRLSPVVTFVLYAGTEPWDGAVTLHQMLDFNEIPDELRELTSDYKINLIDIRRYEETDLFKTDIRQVFNFIRCANDKRKLKELVESDSYYQKMDESAFDVVTQYTRANELIETKEHYGKDGVVNMCKALTELIEEGREEGREEGILLTKKVYKFSLEGKECAEIAKMCDISEDEVRKILE